jgi:hypothetical protein
MVDLVYEVSKLRKLLPEIQFVLQNIHEKHLNFVDPKYFDQSDLQFDLKAVVIAEHKNRYVLNGCQATESCGHRAFLDIT